MTNIRPQDDFYMHQNQKWLEEAKIPDDKPVTGAFIEILINNEKTLMKDLAEFAKQGVDPAVYNDPLFDQFIKLYRQALDTKKREADGNGFIKDYVARILEVKTIADLEKLTADFVLEGLPNIFSLSIYADMKNASINTLYLSMPNLFLPEKSYYDEASPAFTKGKLLLQKRMEIVKELFAKIGIDEADEIIANALAFDKLLVPLAKSAEEQSNYIANYNPYSFTDLESKVAPFNLKRILKMVVKQEVLEVIVTDPRYVESFAQIIGTDLSLIKAWYIVKTVLNFSSSGIGTDDLRKLAATYGQMLTGQKEITSFEKFTFQSLSDKFGDVVGLYFGHRYFGEEAKKDVELMVHEFIRVYQKRLKTIEWLSIETREKAIRKLDKIVPMIGYPDKVHSVFNKYQLVENKSYAENCLAFDKLAIAEDFATYKQEVDKKLWGMGAHIVNAYYNPNANVIVFPAGILQSPFYDFNQAKGANYGGIGAVIAHEITHAFDTNGASIDENGNINNWWKEEDFKRFNEKAEKMIALFDGLEVPGTNAKCNGKLTVTENIADAGGLSCAYEAGKSHAEFKSEDFFAGWAAIWRMKANPAYVELLTNIDVHAPTYLRCDVQLKNFEPFISFYDLQKEDGMFIEKDKRVKIW
jgi:putative endopeptidase